MNANQLREMRRYLRDENQRYKSGVFEDVPKDQWPNQKYPPSKVLRSREFLVQIFEETVTRISINRTELDNDGNWKDGITWDEMQSVKDGCGYSDFDAVEAHPRKEDVVNVANMRHLWIVPPDYAKFFWRKKDPLLKSHVSTEA